MKTAAGKQRLMRFELVAAAAAAEELVSLTHCPQLQTFQGQRLPRLWFQPDFKALVRKLSLHLTQ